MKHEELDLVVKNVRELPFLTESQYVHIQSLYVFYLVDTDFVLDFRYHYDGESGLFDYEIVWRENKLSWKTYSLFEVIDKVPDDIKNHLLFNLNSLVEGDIVRN